MKKYLSLILAFALALSLAACTVPAPAAPEHTQESTQTAAPQSTQPDTQQAQDTTQTPQASNEHAVTYPVTVTDQLGRKVVIEKEPETLVSGYYISTSLLIALGLQDKLTGVEAKADTRPVYSLSAPSLLNLPDVGTAKEFDLEGCAALSPDLIVLPAKLEGVLSSLEELGLTVLFVNPEDQKLLTEAVQLLGTATNTMERADALLAFPEERLAAAADMIASDERPSVYLAGNSSFLSTAGPAMYQGSLIEQAGGVNVASELTDSYWTEISYEQLIAWDPDYIVLAADASYTVESVLNDPALAEVSAVKHDRVFQIPGSVEAWDSPVPAGFLGTLYLTGILHPDSYPASSYEQAATEFYETFYGFTPALQP